MSKPATETVELHRFPEATDLPLILYRGAIAAEGKAAAKAFEQLFARNWLARRLAQRHLSLSSLPRDRP